MPSIRLCYQFQNEPRLSRYNLITNADLKRDKQCEIALPNSFNYLIQLTLIMFQVYYSLHIFLNCVLGCSSHPRGAIIFSIVHDASNHFLLIPLCYYDKFETVVVTRYLVCSMRGFKVYG